MSDVWTVVSLCNFPIVGENKPTVQHGPITIPAADKELGVSVFHVHPAICWEFMGASDKAYRMLDREISAKELANSIANDWADAQMCIDNGGRPGIFAVEGEHDAEYVAKRFKDRIKEARERHVIWAKQLIAMADDLWSTEKKHKRIGASMIHAAEFFGLDREWADPTRFIATAITCPSCGTKLSPDVALCMVCRCIVDKEKYEALEFAS